jgi:hypothetical protein
MTDHEINRAVAGARGIYRAVSGNVCTDPAAWGALYEEMPRNGYTAQLEYDGLGTHTAVVNGKQAQDVRPGRALALAFLKAVQP